MHRLLYARTRGEYETFNNLLCSRDVVLANACVPQIGIKLEFVYIQAYMRIRSSICQRDEQANRIILKTLLTPVAEFHKNDRKEFT